MRLGRRGAALGMVIVASIVFSISAFAMITVALSGRHRVRTSHLERLRARYAAEAGLVIAREKLWNEKAVPYPPGCSAGGTGTATEKVDTNGDNVVDTDVAITVQTCGEGNEHVITSKVIY